MGQGSKNILVVGPPDSGKQTAVEGIDSKNSNILSASYGRAIINNQKNYLFSFKGEEGFKSLEDVLLSFENGQCADGIIILIDNSRGVMETDYEVRDMILSMNIPHVVFSNKQDLNNASLNGDLEGSMIIPTIATEGIGVQDGFRLLLKLIEQKENHVNVKKSEYTYRKVFNSKKVHNRFRDAEKLEKLKDILEESENHDICKLRMFMHPIELEGMVKTLENHGFSNMTVVETKYVDNQNTSMETYRCSQYDVQLKVKTEIIMILKKDDVQYVLKAVRSIKSDDIDDKILITPIERVLRVRTLEEGEEAID
ncbi:P-II family nitrogen regulator [Methanobacterium aggregans]|uniref:P-II family nitrogen regulator n=1 Tax=Methanobacterium aggregans TaxID=1615586 RepID=UPI001AEA329E|nr:P-II family nitrogen regulator [Methanobacterium aggregans]MBP2046539.1 nitrogen regulatory protein PII/signal recognition particle receptor subunit beta [Methanobacterium aggregans]